jgi:RNA polymerase sigma-70 factor (ECF subfamily)
MHADCDPDRNGYDARLLGAVARGDRSALARIYGELKDDLVSAAYHLTGDAAAAEDVLQDVFVRLARKAGEIRLREGLRPYLVTSCLNRARDVLRRRARDPAREGALDATPSEAEGPEAAAARRDEARAVRRALAALPEEQREVVVLRAYGRLKFREIASALAISINTAQSRHRYALAALREHLCREGVAG